MITSVNKAEQRISCHRKFIKWNGIWDKESLFAYLRASC